MSTSLSIKGKTQANESTTATVNYVNPNATNAQLVSLATALNDLTTNTIADVTKVSKESIFNDTRLDRNLQFKLNDTPTTTIAFNSIAQIGAQEGTTFEIAFEGSSDTVIPTFTRAGDATNEGFVVIDWYYAEGWWLSMFRDTGTWNGGTITITVPETDIYKAASATLTITNS